MIVDLKEVVKEVVLSAAGNAVIEEKERLTVTVEPGLLHPLIKALCTCERIPFDYLISLTGMDWNDRLGVIYQLSSSKSPGNEIVVITSVGDRNNPLLYSVTDIYNAAHLNEREVYAMFGIRFINNPDMRRFLLPDDWKGFPLRKDYDGDPALNPVTIASREFSDTAPGITEDAAGNLVESTTPVLMMMTTLSTSVRSTFNARRDALPHGPGRGGDSKEDRYSQWLYPQGGNREALRKYGISPDPAFYRPS